MTLQKKLEAAALRGAIEAVREERARVLWTLDSLLRGLEQDLSKKVLQEAQRHLAQVRLQIARSIVKSVRAAVLTGVRPVEKDGLKAWREEVEE